MIIYVSIGDVLAVHQALIELYGGSEGIRDIGLVESALARPQASFGGYDAYPTLFEKAAVLLQGLIKNHGFVDGNKRTGVAVTSIFLKLNRQKLYLTDLRLEKIAAAIANNQLDLEKITTLLKKNSKRSVPPINSG